MHRSETRPPVRPSYRFALPSKTAVLGLPIGQHISLVVDVDGRSISRSYTPTSQFDTQGHFDLMIKVGFPLKKHKYERGCN